VKGVGCPGRDELADLLVDRLGRDRLGLSGVEELHRLAARVAAPTSHSSFASIASIETRRISEASSGKIPTTSVRRAISRVEAFQRVGRP